MGGAAPFWHPVVQGGAEAKVRKGFLVLRGMGLLKHYLKVIGVGVCIGVLAAVVRTAFRIDSAVFWRVYWIAGVAVVFGAALCNVLYVGRYSKRMQDAIAHYEKGETKAFMDEVEDMLRTAKGRNLRNMLELNLTAGYCEWKQFDKAIDILERLSHEHLRGAAKMVQRLNLCVCYFYTAQGARAAVLYRASKKEFAPYRESKLYGGNIAVVEMLAAIEEGQFGRAEELLRQARETWDSPRLQEDYDNIEKKLQEAT